MNNLPSYPEAAAAPPVPLARLLAGEIAVGSVVNILFNLGFAWLVFHGRAEIGRDGVLLDVLPATIIPALMMTFAVTWLMRRRLRDGLTVRPDARLPVVLPQRVALRAPAIALLALALVAVPVVVLLVLSWRGDWHWSDLVTFKLAFSVFHAALIIPVVVLAALGQDRQRPGITPRP